MLLPLIRRPRRMAERRSRERGFTMALVALALTAIIAMAALSIDIGTFYQAKAEAQRAADAAALTAAQVISSSGITGDPAIGATDGSWTDACGGLSSLATVAATKVAQQNLISGIVAPTINVLYGAGSAGASTADCTAAGTTFAINPVVTVSVTSASLPIFFARVFSLIPGVNYSGTKVSAAATAEAFNPSDSSSIAGSALSVQPRCVKPWIVPNADPGNSGDEFVHLFSGRIANPGINPGGVIGETFNLNAECTPGTSGTCILPGYNNPPPTYTGGPGGVLQYVPALVFGNPGAIPSCSPTSGFQAAIAGCDQSTVYACGTQNGASVDLNENPVNPNAQTGDTATAIACVTHSGTTGDADTLVTGTYPFQIQAGLHNPLVKAGLVTNGKNITTSDSIVTIPIANFGGNLVGQTPSTTIVGFLQVFINNVDPTTGNVSVTVMNVAGCTDNATGGSATGTSPVPVRLITPP